MSNYLTLKESELCLSNLEGESSRDALAFGSFSLFFPPSPPPRQCYAYFKKLKFSGTSTQIGGLPFMLKFQVVRDVVVDDHRRLVGVPGLAVYSNPIYVYSHTTYLKGGPKVAAAKKKGTRKVRGGPRYVFVLQLNYSGL